MTSVACFSIPGSAVDTRLHGVPPSAVLACSVTATAATLALASTAASLAATVRRTGAASLLFSTIRSLPIVRSIVGRELDKIIAGMRKDRLAARAATDAGTPPRMAALPSEGMSPAAVLATAESYAAADAALPSRGSGRASGTVYMEVGSKHDSLLSAIYTRFCHSNPLHADQFPAVCRMEREVVAMAASLLGGDESACGCLTSGGTESILTAVRAARDRAAAERGVRQPEMIAAVSAHAAVDKAAAYFGIRLVRVPVDAALRMDLAAVRRALNRRTVLIYASAPGFPHGVIDDVPALGALAAKAGVCLHVDACLGGFFLPFAQRLGLSVPPFDLSVPGVTSMSADTHKYGLAQKGSSVLLYRSAALRRYQFTAVSDWSGGLYVSPSQAGSRSGGLVAQTWAALVHTGMGGYLESTRTVLAAASQLRAGIRRVPGLALLPDGEQAPSMIVAWGSSDKTVDIYAVNDALSAAGWHLNALHRPAALHMCVTPANAGCVPDLLAALGAAVAAVRAAGGRGGEGGRAAVYGLAGGLPDRGAVREVLLGAQDVMLDLA